MVLVLSSSCMFGGSGVGVASKGNTPDSGLPFVCGVCGLPGVFADEE